MRDVYEGGSDVAGKDDDKKVTNRISDQTGQFDARFLLWRKFCSDNNVPVETLPSQLKGEAKENWDKLKEEELKNRKS
ncbi:MAG: hypothetical protein QOE33_1577 [Acidobacteriota bacterium]|jgi:hypothetical protein|nr:hypothetical protein [Acidobacteriota bacterium]